jgi:hypothetical protein
MPNADDKDPGKDTAHAGGGGTVSGGGTVNAGGQKCARVQLAISGGAFVIRDASDDRKQQDNI